MQLDGLAAPVADLQEPVQEAQDHRPPWGTTSATRPASPSSRRCSPSRERTRRTRRPPRHGTGRRRRSGPPRWRCCSGPSPRRNHPRRSSRRRRPRRATGHDVRPPPGVGARRRDHAPSCRPRCCAPATVPGDTRTWHCDRSSIGDDMVGDVIAQQQHPLLDVVDGAAAVGQDEAGPEEEVSGRGVAVLIGLGDPDPAEADARRVSGTGAACRTR